MKVLGNGSTADLTVRKLWDTVDRQFQSGATVVCALKDEAGAVISGASAIPLAQVTPLLLTGRNVLYRGELSHTISLPAGTVGEAVYTATSSAGKVRKWTEAVRYEGLVTPGVPHDSLSSTPGAIISENFASHANLAAWIADAETRWDSVFVAGDVTLENGELVIPVDSDGVDLAKAITAATRVYGRVMQYAEAGVGVGGYEQFGYTAEVGFSYYHQPAFYPGVPKWRAPISPTVAVDTTVDVSRSVTATLKSVIYCTEGTPGNPAHGILWVGGNFVAAADSTADADLPINTVTFVKDGSNGREQRIRLIEFVDGSDMGDERPWTGMDDPGSPSVPDMDIFPSEVMVAPLGTMQFSASLEGVSLTPSSWQCTGGSIDSNGLFTAGVTEGEYTVTAVLSGYNNSSAPVEVSDFDFETDIPDLHSYCDFHDEGLSNNASVSAITDGTGDSHGLVQATAGARPTYKTNVLNGKNVVQFDGDDDYLTAEEVAVPQGARTTFILCRRLTGGANPGQVVFMGSRGWFRISADIAAGGWIVTTAETGSTDEHWFSAPPNTDWTLFVARVNSADSLDAFVNDLASVNLTKVDNIFSEASDNTIAVGRHEPGDEAKCQHAIYHHVTRALTNAEIRQAKRWLNARFRAY